MEGYNSLLPGSFLALLPFSPYTVNKQCAFFKHLVQSGQARSTRYITNKITQSIHLTTSTICLTGNHIKTQKLQEAIRPACDSTCKNDTYLRTLAINLTPTH